MLGVVVGRRVEQVPDGCGRRHTTGSTRSAGERPAGRHREREWCEIDEVSLLDADRERASRGTTPSPRCRARSATYAPTSVAPSARSSAMRKRVPSSQASVTTTGRTPTPITNAPTAHRPYVSIRCVEVGADLPRSRSGGCRTRRATIEPPTESTTTPMPLAPTTSPRSARARARRCRHHDGARRSPARMRTVSSERTAGASASASAAATASSAVASRAARAPGARGRAHDQKYAIGLGDEHPRCRRATGSRRSRSRQAIARRPRHEEPRERVGGEERRGHRRPR